MAGVHTHKMRWKTRITILWIMSLISPAWMQERPRRNDSDPCPHTLQPDDSNAFKLVLVGDNICCGCNPGFHVEKHCLQGLAHTTWCEPCPSGHFISQKAHKLETCHSHQVCSEDESVILQGTSTADTKCGKRTTADNELMLKIQRPTESIDDSEKTKQETMSTIPATKQSTSMTVSTEALTIVGDSMSFWVYLGPVFAGFSLLLLLILLGICIKNCLKKRQRCAGDRRVSTESDNLEDDTPRESDSLLRNLNKTERNRCQDSGNSSLIRADSRVELSLYQRSDLDNRRDSQFSFSPLTAKLQIDLLPRPTSLVISTSSDGATSLKCRNSSTSTLSSDRLDQYTQDMMNLCYALAKVITPDDIRPFFRDLTILSNPEVEIQNLPPHESPREQFIRLFNVLVCHGVEHFTPQKIVNVCYKNGWMTYSEVVIFHFPDAQLARMTSCSGGEGL